MSIDQIRVMIVGSDKSAREELLAKLGSEMGMSVVGQADTGEEAVVTAGVLSPDVILVDTEGMIPGSDCINAARAITGGGTSRVAIITDNVLRELVPAIKAGAAGVLSPDMSQEDLILAIRGMYLHRVSSSHN